MTSVGHDIVFMSTFHSFIRYREHYVKITIIFSECSGLTSFINSLELFTTVVVRSDVTGPDSSRF